MSLSNTALVLKPASICNYTSSPIITECVIIIHLQFHLRQSSHLTVLLFFLFLKWIITRERKKVGIIFRRVHTKLERVLATVLEQRPGAQGPAEPGIYPSVIRSWRAPKESPRKVCSGCSNPRKHLGLRAVAARDCISTTSSATLNSSLEKGVLLFGPAQNCTYVT